MSVISPHLYNLLAHESISKAECEPRCGKGWNPLLRILENSPDLAHMKFPITTYHDGIISNLFHCTGAWRTVRQPSFLAYGHIKSPMCWLGIGTTFLVGMASPSRMSGGSHCAGKRSTWWIVAGNLICITHREACQSWSSWFLSNPLPSSIILREIVSGCVQTSVQCVWDIRNFLQRRAGIVPLNLHLPYIMAYA
jgi:hypothetical protein